MRLFTQLVSGWPKLAWTAVLTPVSEEIQFLHGPRVEVCEDWAVEAVWAGDFEAGDFDRTDLIFGSGVRCREDQVVFVTSGTIMDRLWYYRKDEKWYVSNSLGALCACADLSLLEDFCYVNDRQSAIRTTWGVESCTGTFPTDSGEGHLIWFHNLIYENGSFREESKSDTAPAFNCYEDYRNFLFETARSLGRNMESSGRSHKVIPLASVSSGYDSAAAAAVAKYAGCIQAVTIKQSSSFWRGSDSGREIARYLGLSCRSYDRQSDYYPHEESFWAASGYSNLLSWTLFDYPEPACLFFIGCYGDAIWDRKKHKEPFGFHVWDDLAMSECRLFQGMLQCAVPFWGMRRVKEIEGITFSEEMAPWTMHNTYDRPIARRLVEEAGVPRGAFAIRKKDTSHEAAFRWPYSRESQARFRQYLASRSLTAPRPFVVRLLRRLAHLESLIYLNITNKLDIRMRVRPWLQLKGLSLLFHWANEELKREYRKGLEEVGMLGKEFNSGRRFHV
jgi:hypothetical protein